MKDSLTNKQQYTYSEMDSVFANNKNIIYAYSDSYIVKPYDETTKKVTKKIRASDTLSIQQNNEWQQWEPKGENKPIIIRESEPNTSSRCDYDGEFTSITFLFVIGFWVLRFLK
jgi:hypothetical protein